MIGWYLARGASKEELERLTENEEIFYLANMMCWTEGVDADG